MEFELILKRNRLNFDLFWERLMNLLKNLENYVYESYAPITNSRKIKYLYCGRPLAFHIKENAYFDVDIFTDYFTEAVRLRAHRYGKISPAEFYEQHKERLTLTGKNDPHEIREVLYRESCECTQFKITLYVMMLQLIGRPNVKILDPSSGWGDRMLGAIAYGAAEYFAVDPNKNLEPGYSEIISKAMGIKITAQYKSFLEIDVPNLYFDVVATSPPFWNYEIYDNDPAQSIRGFNNSADWFENFMIPYLTKAWNAIKYGGYMMLYINDAPSGESYMHKLVNFMASIEGCKFKGTIAVYGGRGLPQPLWVWSKL